MHPADQQEFEKLHQERAELRKRVNDSKEELRVLTDKHEHLKGLVKALNEAAQD